MLFKFRVWGSAQVIDRTGGQDIRLIGRRNRIRNSKLAILKIKKRILFAWIAGFVAIKMYFNQATGKLSWNCKFIYLMVVVIFCYRDQVRRWRLLSASCSYGHPPAGWASTTLPHPAAVRSVKSTTTVLVYC